MKTFLVQPLITEKSLALSANGVYQFVVPTWANKQQIAEHVGRHFGVTVVNVTTATIGGETVRFRQKSGQRAFVKKATVRVKQGDSIADFSLPVEAEQAPTATAEEKTAPAKEVKTESKITVRSKGDKKTKAEEK